MIRPRGGEFCYSELEYELMKDDVAMAKSLGADGVVFGFLMEDGTIDCKRTGELIRLAAPMSVTFHRAFDKVKDPVLSLKSLIEVGADRVLTSGHKPTAFDGKELITSLIDHAKDKITIMPGSGVNTNNVLELLSHTGAKEVHLSGKFLRQGKMGYKNNIKMNALANIEEDSFFETDVNIIREIIEKLQSSY